MSIQVSTIPASAVGRVAGHLVPIVGTGAGAPPLGGFACAGVYTLIRTA